jgi:VanZ family protein
VPEALLRRVFRLGFWSALCIATVAALLPQGTPLPVTDVFLHTFSFVVLTALLGLAYYERTRWTMPVRWMALFGLALEVVQSTIPGRSAELKDLLVDAIGIGLGVALWYLALEPLLRRAAR